MFFIGYKQLDKLLYKIPQLKAKVENLRIELAKLDKKGMDQNLQDDILYSLYVGNHELTDMPHGFSNPGDKLLRAIQAKDRIIKELYPRDLADMCIIMADAINKVEITLKLLSDQEKEIVNLRYFRVKEWKEISEILCSDPSWLGDVRKKAVEKMAEALFMQTDQWEFCMRYVK